MDGYILSCCSTVDLPAEQMERRNLSYICFHYFLDGKEYLDDLGQTMENSVFYEKMIEGADTSTSQVSVGEYLEYFEKYMKEGKDVLHVTLSSGISGSYASAKNAAEMLKEKYPDRKLYVVDSLCASSGYGFFMDALADRRDEGMSVDELHRWALDNRGRMQHWFFSSDLKWYVKGGRVSAPAGFIGGILGICPVLYVNSTGHLIPEAKVRTKKRAIQALVDRMVQYADGGKDYSGKVYICQSYCREDAEATAALVEKTFPKMEGKVQICNIGTVIGSHTGPGTIAVFFWGQRKD